MTLAAPLRRLCLAAALVAVLGLACPAAAGETAPPAGPAGQSAAPAPAAPGEPRVKESPSDAPAPLPESDLSGAFIQMLGGLALVLGLLIGLYWLSRRLFPSLSSGGAAGLKLLGRLALGQRNFVALVEVADRVLILGVSHDGIRLLDKVDDPEQVAGLRPAGPQLPSFKRSLKKAQQAGDES